MLAFLPSVFAGGFIPLRLDLYLDKWYTFNRGKIYATKEI